MFLSLLDPRHGLFTTNVHFYCMSGCVLPIPVLEASIKFECFFTSRNLRLLESRRAERKAGGGGGEEEERERRRKKTVMAHCHA